MAIDRPLSLLVSRLLLADEAAGGTAAPSPFPEPNSTRPYASVAPFRPGIAVIVGVLTIMFSLTFLLLLYAKHCKRTGGAYGASGAAGGFVGSRYPTSAVERRHSGVDRAVVDLLPVFRFGSLRGQKEWLECAVCLNRFEPAEALRLLPKCRHAFHVECVDTWLDAHSTCPLCRVRVDPEDILLVPRPEPESEPLDGGGGGGEKRRQSKSRGGNDGAAKTVPFPFARKFPGRHSSAGERRSDSLQIVVHRIHDPADSKWWKRRSADCKRCAASASTAAAANQEPPKVRKDGLLPTTTTEDEQRLAFERRHSHRIVVTGGEEKVNRWSDLRPSDLLFLRTEMIVTGSGRFSASKTTTTSPSSKSSSSAADAAATSRCASDLAGVSRFPTASSGAGSGGFSGRRDAEEERTLRRWLGFAGKRTARLLGRREEGGHGDGGANS